MKAKKKCKSIKMLGKCARDNGIGDKAASVGMGGG